jgi:type IV pilus assembly protein PilA
MKNSKGQKIVFPSPKDKTLGFTISEVLVTLSITSILASMAFPNYLSQVNRSRQNEASSAISQIQTTIAAYTDEFGFLPTSWSELNDISAIMTQSGPAIADNFLPITLAGGFYDVTINNTNNLFVITATSTQTPELNIIGCINLSNGASAINQGIKSAAATAPSCG